MKMDLVLCLPQRFHQTYWFAELEQRAERTGGGGGGSAMASQQLNPQMRPKLGVSESAALPPGKLASQHDFLRLMFHQQHYNLTGSPKYLQSQLPSPKALLLKFIGTCEFRNRDPTFYELRT